jgi:hypothetical protein
MWETQDIVAFFGQKLTMSQVSNSRVVGEMPEGCKDFLAAASPGPLGMSGAEPVWTVPL